MTCIRFTVARRLTALGASVAVLALAPVAGAAPAAAPAPPDTAVYFTAPIVVTAVRPTPVFTVETNPREPRQPVPASDGADYLRTIPGFASIRYGGTNADPVLRGMQGSRLNVLTDGACMLGACPGRMDAPSSYIAPESYDKLVVVKGPQTVAWGPGASAGTIQFERLAPEAGSGDSRVEPALLLGSWGRNDERVGYAGLSGRADARLDLTRSESGDYRDGDGEVVPSRWLKWNADAAVGFRPGTGSRLEVNAGTGDGEARYAGRAMDGTQFQRRSVGAEFKRESAGTWRNLDLRASWHDADHIMDNYSLREPDPSSMMPMPMAAEVDRQTFDARAATEFALAGGLRLLAGADLRADTHRGRSGMGVDGNESADWSSDADMRTVGLFAEAGHGVGERSRVTLGARTDFAYAKDRRTGTGGMMPMPNPTAGQTRDDVLPGGFARWLVSFGPDASMFAGLGYVARFADYWELFSPDAGPTGSVNAFAGVRPERTTQLDVGAQVRSGRLLAWASGYAGEVRDFILFTYTSGMMGSTSSVENVDARIAGGEAGLGLAMGRRWNGEVSMAYAWGENRTAGGPLPQIPPLETRASLRYDDQRAWSAAALVRFAAEQNRVAVGQGNVVGQDIGPSDAFAVLSLNGARRLPHGMRLAVGVDNLLDETYSEHLNLAGDSAFGYPAEPVRVHEPGRTVWAKLDLRH